MAGLVAKGIRVVRGPLVVLDGVDLTVGPQSRIGVLGPNGAGKSTLLQVLAGQVSPEAGSVDGNPPGVTVGYLPQEPDRRPGETLAEFFGRRTGVSAAQAALTTATEQLSAGEPGSDEAYPDALERWLALGGADLAERAAEVCGRLGLEVGAPDTTVASLSGGQAARASLASILLSRFEVFLLDEPTNDLDFAGLAQLEEFVAGLSAGLVLVSHDREFLARTVSSVLEIDGPLRTATLYNGGWEAYRELRAVARQHARQAYEAYADKREDLVGMAQRQREMSVRGAVRAKRRSPDNDRARKGARMEAATSAAAKVRITEGRLARLDATGVAEPRKEWQLQLRIAQAPRSGQAVATLRGAVVRRGAFTLGPVDLSVGWADRIAVSGPNGSGKSTLLAALFGPIDLDSGSAVRGPGVVVGGIDQAREAFRGAGPTLDVVEQATGLTAADARTLLAKFGLRAEHVLRPAGTLSPGERTRAGLALLQGSGVNCLVLDEPTNHLDLPAIEQLEEALEAYTGTLLLVTHDRRLADTVRITRRWLLAEGQVREG